MATKSCTLQLRLPLEFDARESRALPASPKKARFQLLLFHAVGLPIESVPSLDRQYIQVSAELKDSAAKRKHPPQQVAADIRYATRFLRY